jgi:hypothetical protein
MEPIFKLNLPPLDQVLLESKLSILNHGKHHPIYRNYHSNELFKPEWINFLNYNWDIALHFYKPTNFIGRIHTDSTNPEIKPWGINWISGGNGTMSHWNFSTLPDPTIFVDECGFLIHRYYDSTDIPPDYNYHMTPGAYLVNATLPHRPTSLGQRHCISLRSSSGLRLDWENAVELFKNFII